MASAPTLGSHVSAAGGPHRAIERALKVGCDCLQIFTKNNNQWRAKPLEETAIEAWKRAWQQAELRNPIAHASYLINLASPKNDLYEKSIEALAVEMDRANQLQLEGLVVHPGAFTDSSEQEGIDRIVDGVLQVLDHAQTGNCKLLLENTAGQGTCLGHRLPQLGEMLNRIDQPDSVGVCFDTCHAFAAGYDLRTAKGFKVLRQEIDDTFAPGTITAIHLNDSKKPLGSRVDRHEHIGRGELGLGAFRRLFQDDLFRKLPGYLETEKGIDEESEEEWDVINLRALRQCCK